MAGGLGAEKRGIDARDDDAGLRLEADARDDAADERDASADERDRTADARDAHAEVRDAAVSDQPDPAGTRQFAAQDRHASSDDRLRARDDRRASSWDRSVAEQIRAQLIAALDDADKLPEATLLIGQAQGMLISTFGGNAAEAMIEIADRADRDQVGLQEAARRILADGAPSGIHGIRVPE